MRSISCAIAIAVALTGCSSAAPAPPLSPPPGAASPSPDPMLVAILATVDRELVERPGDGVLLYLRVLLSVPVDGARDGLRFLERLDTAGWDVPFVAAKFGALARDPAYDAIRARVEARAPRVVRSTLSFSIAGPDLIPEGIACDRGTFYVGSIRKRTIVAVDAAGASRVFVPPRRDGLMAVLGIKVDAARGLLWATSYAAEGMEGYTAADRDAGAVYAFALADGTLRRRIDVARGGLHLLNDLALAGDGTVYVTDSVAGAVWRIPPDRDTLEPLVAAGTLVYPNGIALARGRLYVAQLTGIAIVDPATGAIRQLEAPPRVWLGKIDGLLVEGDALVGVQTLGAPRLVSIALDAAGDRATALTVLENDPRTLELPTTTCAWRGALYTIANAQLDALGPEGLRPDKRLADPRIVRTPL